jgi:3-dehydroquinate synthase
MIINYRVNQEKHKVKFCSQNNKDFIVSDLKKLISDKKILFLYDKNIDELLIRQILDNLKLSGCKVFIMELEGAKVNKNEKLLFKIIDILIKNNFTKKSVVISCGGGVVGDVSALASSIYLRGLIYFHIPTTMTAIVDSCIGGKTGINYKGIINSLGSYYHPKNVYILESIIKLIPEREYLAGIPEVIKYGLIDNKTILNFLRNNKKSIVNRNFNRVSKMCKLALLSKIKFFSKDVHEKNQRLKLNFGHTFAHAIEMTLEKYFKKDYIRHGEAVGIGILCELYYSNPKRNKILKFTKNLLEMYNLPTKLSSKKIKSNIQAIQSIIYKNIFLDKKKINQFPRYIKLTKLGKAKVMEMKNYDQLNETIFKIIF